jgi:hypothetical protein
MKWGGSQAHDTIYSVLITPDTDIQPLGYFTGGGGELVSEWSGGLADDVNVDTADNVLGRGLYEREHGLPFFLGPDGEQDTEDDLPIFVGDVSSLPLFSDPYQDPDFTVDSPSCGRDGRCGYTVLGELGSGFRDDPSQIVTPESCQAAVDAGAGQQRGGVNAAGQCVLIFSQATGSRVQPQGIGETAALEDDLVPDSAFIEPQDLTGIKQLGGPDAIPARPRNRNRALYFKTAGLERATKKYHHLVSNLDVDFREDELKWSHGASQDEHEFKEGYLELEMFDSQLFARVGKLVMVWGKTELFRNQDRLNPTDIGIVTLPNLEEARIGQWATDVTWYWGYLGPAEDVRFEFVAILDEFEPTDLGKCGEPFVFLPVCAKSFGSMASGLAGLGLVGENRPDDPWDDLKGMDVAFRMEGRWDRFTFAISDFWGYDDSAILKVVHEYGRRVDPETGAPVRSTGALSCKVKSLGVDDDLDGKPDRFVSVGPDGVVGTGDDKVPSVGNCLLFEKDGTTRRSADDVALNHSINQTLFHTLCSLTFNEDKGFCAFDSLNSQSLLGPGSIALAGDPLSSLSNAIFFGWDTSRLADNRFRPLTIDGDLTQKYVTPLGIDPKNLGSLPPDQQALLGCGDRFGSGCGLEQADALVAAGVLDTPAGGIDFMNADASVLTQEFSILKAGSPGALVGYRRGAGVSYFEAGVTTPDDFTPDDAVALEASSPPGSANAAVGGLTEAAYDFEIEPFPWDPNPELLRKGVLLFDSSLPNPLGENCGPVGPGAQASTCTDLERFSSNLERILISDEITGNDDSFDPPESLEELLFMLDARETTDIGFDPISGPDGIFFGNADTSGDGLRDTKAIRSETLPTLAKDLNLDGEFTQEDAVAGDACTAALCYRQIGSDMASTGELPAGDDPGRYVDAKPVFVLVRDEDKGFPSFILGTDDLAFQQLSQIEQQKLLTTDSSQFDPDDPTTFLLYDIDLDGVDEKITLRNEVRNDLLNADLDSDSFADVDNDKDGKLDWVDDFTAGPISDDNILCGSGIPGVGDPLQDALQHEFYDTSQEGLLGTVFEAFGGLPPRSPVFCRSLTGLLGATGFTLPYKRAGGDNRFGRRDFLWQGGRQVMLDYQKKNVFGFGLDFAEDRTKSSWGIEFSWTSGKFFGNTLSRDLLHRSDEYVLSISMDRPTFINFLNPNRTFFMNFQIFFKYFSDFEGGDRRGMFGTSDGPFDTRFIFFFFTGYFQDRLTPRVTLVADPPTSTGAVLSTLSYRFTDRFSASVGMNHFFGHVSQTEAPFFPVALLSGPDRTSETLRGIAPARNRDEIFMTVRWTF